jgi:4-hydroxy-tetrahydrodipicolinate synthase
VLFIESNPIPIKYAMYEAGLMPTLEYRLPLVEPCSENKKKIKEILDEYL